MAKIKCNKCEFVGESEEFRQGRDLFQMPFISGCPKCDNRQSPGEASMRCFGGERPFEFVRASEPSDLIDKVAFRAEEAS